MQHSIIFAARQGCRAVYFKLHIWHTGRAVDRGDIRARLHCHPQLQPAQLAAHCHLITITISNEFMEQGCWLHRCTLPGDHASAAPEPAAEAVTARARCHWAISSCSLLSWQLTVTSSPLCHHQQQSREQGCWLHRCTLPGDHAPAAPQSPAKALPACEGAGQAGWGLRFSYPGGSGCARKQCHEAAQRPPHQVAGASPAAHGWAV